jgi:hypothetical protein
LNEKIGDKCKKKDGCDGKLRFHGGGYTPVGNQQGPEHLNAGRVAICDKCGARYPLAGR